MTVLPAVLIDPLRQHLADVRRLHATDLSEGGGRVVLPDALERKYPYAATEWAWQFVLPASRICQDPRWGPPSRFHLHESAVQKAVAGAVRRSGIANRVERNQQLIRRPGILAATDWPRELRHAVWGLINYELG